MGRTLEHSAPAVRSAATHHRGVTRALVGVAIALVVVSVWGYVLRARGVQLHLGVVPFFGWFHFAPTIGVITTVVAAASIVTVGTRLAVSLSFRSLVLAAWAAATMWAVALATTTGLNGLTSPLTSRYDYWAAMPALRQAGLGPFVRTYLDRVTEYPVHAQGHPPGLLALYGLLDRLGLHGPGWAAATVIVFGSSAVAAVLIATRSVAGAETARRAAPFLVLAPMALFVATTGDAVFMALAAWSVALLTLAADRRSLALAAAAGSVGAMTLYFTYGLVPLLAALGVVVLWRADRALVARLVAAALAGAAVVVAAWTAAGFWWLDGLQLAHHLYGVRAGNDRPYGYFLIADLVVFAVMLGPAGIAGLVRVRRHPVVALVAAALVAVAIADLSGLSKAEVERIWLPFLPWVLLATATLPRVQVRRWLIAQAALAIGLQLTIAWPW